MLIPKVRRFTVRYPLSLIYVLLFCSFAFGLFWTHHVDQREIRRLRTVQVEGTYGSCLKVNRVIDGLYSLVDDRAPLVKNFRAVVRDKTATRSQKDRARVALGRYQVLERELKASITVNKCKRP